MTAAILVPFTVEERGVWNELGLGDSGGGLGIWEGFTLVFFGGAELEGFDWLGEFGAWR